MRAARPQYYNLGRRKLFTSSEDPSHCLIWGASNQIHAAASSHVSQCRLGTLRQTNRSLRNGLSALSPKRVISGENAMFDLQEVGLNQLGA